MEIVNIPFCVVFACCLAVVNCGGQLCLSCNKVYNPYDCTRVIPCQQNETCYTEKLIKSSLTVYYTLGCIEKEVCTGYSVSLFGKRESNTVVLPKRQASDHLVSMKCCDGNHCNLDLYGPVTTTTATKTTTTETVNTATALVHGVPALSINRPSSQQFLYYSQGIMATCSSPDHGVTLQWAFSGSATLPHDARADNHGHLWIYNLDEANAGVYRCYGLSPNGKINSIDYNVSIIDDKADAQRIYQTPPSSNLSTGNTICLSCYDRGYPLPEITWKHGVQGIPPGVTYSEDNRVLTIAPYVPALHDGWWSCKATNKFGESSAFHHLP